MRYTLTLIILLASCTLPDTARVGGGFRDESFGTTDYQGPQGWVEAEWYLSPRPMVIDYSTDTRLFLQGDRPASAPVSVTVAGDESSSVIGDTIKMAGNARNPDGTFSWEGVVLVLALAAIGSIVFIISRRKTS